MHPTTRFAELVQGPEDQMALDEAALLIAGHAYPGLDVDAQRARLDELAESCPEPTFEAWQNHLFDDLGFSGGSGDYYDARNSHVNDVLDSRCGLPITLSVIGIEVGRRLGLPFEGIGMPGHFLLRFAGGTEPEVFVDPFQRGARLDRLGCVQRFHAVNPPTAPFIGSYLDPVGPRAILGRMLQNLKGAYTRNGAVDDLTWVFDLRLAIPGISPLERREGARLQAAGGRFDLAAHQLEDLADSVPESADDLLVEARALRARLN